jgi:hypothetical protein
MVEEPKSTSREPDLQFYTPSEHVRIMKEKYPEEDLSEYFEEYSLNIVEDSRNSFYGANVRFSNDGLKYNEEKSKEHKERVEERLSWLVEFEYTPKEIREKIDEFLEAFKEKSLSNGQEWTEVVNGWNENVIPLTSKIRVKRAKEKSGGKDVY